MKYTITAPNEAYNRKLCGVQFTDGIGQTDDEWAASWFSGREGFTVKSDDSGKEKPVDSMTVPELKTYAAENGVDLTGLSTKADILAKIKEVKGGE